MTLTKEEIEMIEREAYSLYPKEEPDSYFMDASILQRDAHISCRKECLQKLKAERERAGKLMEALEEWKQAHENFDSGYKNIDGKATRMDIAALSVECNSADRKLLSEFRKYNKQP